jgi:hypothetical protein
MAADNSLALAKLEKEQQTLESQRNTLQNQLYAVAGALNFCTYLIGVITKPPAEEAAATPENANGADPAQPATAE